MQLRSSRWSLRTVGRLGAGLAVAWTWAAAGAETLYFSHIFYPNIEDGFIQRVDLDQPFGTPPETLAVTGSGLRGLALDTGAGHMFWADTNDLVIRRADLDGTNIIDVITQDLEWPRTIALDLDAGKMYYGDQLANFIGKANLDGSSTQTLRSTAFHAGIAIDKLHGKIYWSTSDTMFKGKIVRTNLDGTSLEVVVDVPQLPEFKPAGVAVDPAGGKIYWTDYVVDVVRRSNLDGTGIEDLFWVGSNRNPRPIAVDATHGKVYWGQDLELSGYTGSVMRMDLDGGNPETVVTDLGLVVELAIVESPSCNPCDSDCNGTVNQFDIQPFLDTLAGASPPCAPCAGDTNADGSLNQFDIQGFVNCLSGG